MKCFEFAPAVSHTSGWLLCYRCIHAQHLELFAVAEIMTKLFMLTKEKMTMVVKGHRPSRPTMQLFWFTFSALVLDLLVNSKHLNIQMF